MNASKPREHIQKSPQKSGEGVAKFAQKEMFFHLP